MASVPKRAWKALHQPRVYITVEPVLLVFMFAQFLSYSAFQGFLLHRLCELDLNCTSPDTNSTPCGNVSSSVQQEVQKQTSHWILYINIATGLPAIFLSIFYGGISDLIGRRIFIVLPTIGAILNTAVILLAMYIPDIPLYVLLVGAFCNGVYGNYSVLNFAVYSYASDVSATSGRTRQIGILESMTYLGATLSQIIGGVWVQKTNSYSSPFWCILACQFLVILYTVVALPESLKFNSSHGKRPRSAHVQHSPSHRDYILNRCGKHLKAVGVNLVHFLQLLFTNWKLALLIVTFFVVEINFLGITDVVIIYALGEPLCWTFDLIGYFLAAKVFMNGVASLVVLPVFVFLRVHDAVIVLIGLVTGAAALIMMGFGTHTWIMFLVPVVGAMRGCVVPCVRSMLSKGVPSDKQGVLFSGVSIVEASCTLLASVLYNALFPATYRITPGFCFFVMAAALIIPFILILFFHLTRNLPGHCCHSVANSNGHTQHERKPLLAAHNS